MYKKLEEYPYHYANNVNEKLLIATLQKCTS